MSIPAFLFQSRSEEKNTDRCVALDNASGPYTAEEAIKLTGLIQQLTNRLLNDTQEKKLCEALLHVPGVRPLELEHLEGLAAFDVEKAVCHTAGGADAPIILFALRSAIEKHGQAALAVWCNVARALADFRRIHQIAARERSDDENRYMKELENLVSSSMYRPFPEVPKVSDVLAVAEHFPNFSEPIRFVAEQVALTSLRGKTELRLPPMLFVGPPGIGKTYFALALAELLGSQVETIDMAGASSGMMLSGLDRGWGTARPGIVYTSLAQGKSMSPVIILDEVDKVSGSANHSPIGALFQLLEPRTSANFRDEFVAFGVDASHVVWIATANELEEVPAALRSRFQVFHVDCPDERQLRMIAASIYSAMRKDLPGTPEEMPEAWQNRLDVNSLREARIVLQRAFGRAAIRAALSGDESLAFHGDDLVIDQTSLNNRRIGF